MSVVYSDADDEARSLLDGVMWKHFGELSRLVVPLVVDLRMALTDGDDEKPAVKRHGVGVAAKVAVVGPVERSKGGADVRVVLDEARWNEMGTEARKACLFSELLRVEPRRDKHGALKLDPYDRPVVRLRPYDYCVAGYIEAARVFGDDSVERRELDAVEDSLRQKDFGFMTSKAAALSASAAT